MRDSNAPPLGNSRKVSESVSAGFDFFFLLFFIPGKVEIFFDFGSLDAI